MTGQRGTPHTSPSGHFPLPLFREAAAGLGGGESVFSKGGRIGGGDVTYTFLWVLGPHMLTWAWQGPQTTGEQMT